VRPNSSSEQLQYNEVPRLARLLVVGKAITVIRKKYLMEEVQVCHMIAKTGYCIPYLKNHPVYPQLLSMS
jgi:hypothetical protein